VTADVLDGERLVHHYAPRGAARALLECREPEILMSGPAGTGKSRACLEKLHLQSLKYPGAHGLIVRKTAVSLTSSALQTWEETVIPEALRTGLVTYHGGSRRHPPQYRYANGSTVSIGGMDKPSKIMSTEYDVVFVQEAVELTVDDWEAIVTRLRHGTMPYQQVIADTNPSAPTHWLKKRCDDGATRILGCRHTDNPVYFHEDGTPTDRGRDYVEGKLGKLTGVRRLRLKDGLWVAAEGVIYEEWDPAVNLVDRFWIPRDWDRWWVVDFGYTNPFVWQCWAEDTDGRLFLYREIYRTRQLVEDHARTVLAQVTDQRTVPPGPDGQPDYLHRSVRWTEPEPRGIVCDHDAEGRATLERHLGRSTTAAEKNVADGIDATKSRIRPAGDGRPRLFVLRDSLVELDQDLDDRKLPVCTVDEIGAYVWDKQKEAPVKDNDHGMDAMRYLVAERDLGGQPNVRFM
jgi:phage terminase large subunit